MFEFGAKGLSLHDCFVSKGCFLSDSFFWDDKKDRYADALLFLLHYDKLNAQGYSLGVKIIWMMSKLGANLIEVPIHFRDRNKGKSKIPKFQIFVSFFDLLYIKFYENLFKLNFDNENKSYKFENHCEKANDCFFSLKKKNYICLVCNLKLK